MLTSTAMLPFRFIAAAHEVYQARRHLRKPFTELVLPEVQSLKSPNFLYMSVYMYVSVYAVLCTQCKSLDVCSSV